MENPQTKTFVHENSSHMVGNGSGGVSIGTGVTSGTTNFSIQIPKEIISTSMYPAAGAAGIVSSSSAAVVHEKKPRRARTNSSDRNHICGCGKTYLSYPALYTHIKQKHEGKTPEGTRKPDKGKGQRGRKQSENTTANNNKQEARIDEEDGEDEEEGDVEGEERNGEEEDDEDEGEEAEDDNGNNQSNGSEDSESIIDDLVFFLYNRLNDKSIILNDVQSNSLKDFQDAFSQKFFEDPNDFIPIMQQLIEGMGSVQSSIAEENGIVLANCNQIIVQFIKEIGQHLRSYALQEMVLFACCLRKAINEAGPIILAQLGVQYAKQGEFCSVNSGFYIPHVFNAFITEILPKYLRIYELQQQQQQQHYMQQQNHHLHQMHPHQQQQQQLNKGRLPQNRIVNLEGMETTVASILQYFSNWLFAKRYTNLVINREEPVPTMY